VQRQKQRGLTSSVANYTGLTSLSTCVTSLMRC
jgi:hypothetical protein